jgi:hypothetical protein
MKVKLIINLLIGVLFFSIMTNFLVELLGSFERRIYHLAKHGFLFFEIRQLVLEVRILLFLIQHAQF